MEDVIIIVVLAAIVGGIVFYLYRKKKRGETCIGCPYAKECPGKRNGHCGETPKNDSDFQK